MASMERKWEECFGGVPEIWVSDMTMPFPVETYIQESFKVRVCRKCEGVVRMWGDEPGMDHVRFHEELHRGLHP